MRATHRTCRRCGSSVDRKVWPRDVGGHLLSHCGCRTAKTRHCHLCGCEYTVNAPRQMHCKNCQPKAARLQRNRIKMRDRWTPGAAVRLHDGHVRVYVAAVLQRGFQSWRQEQAKPKREELHDAHVATWRSCKTLFYRWRYRHDEEFRIKERLRRQLRKKANLERIEAVVRSSIHKDTPGFAIERLLGYSMSDLKKHLERQFRSGMNWKTYGRSGWHIDHIKPKRCFDLTRIDEVRAFWSLPNLRPLPARENLKKNQCVYHLL